MANGSPTPSPSPSPSPAPPTVEDAVSWWSEFLTSGAPWSILGIVVGSVVLSFVLSRLIHRLVRRAVRSSSKGRRWQIGSAAQTERREQRANAIGQLVRSAVLIVIWASAVMMILGQLGLNIAPLLASASVIGVALGFGAQTLVKDFLSGVFLILEDQFGVGDFVDLGDAVGTVEEVTLRVTRLRDSTGVVWYVRNGEILRVANRSQGWTLAIVDIPVGYEEDLDHVHEVVDATAERMTEDPDCPITPFSKPVYAGVESVSGEAVYIRITAKSDPDDQLMITRLLREGMKQAFDREGIRVPMVFRIPGTVPGATGATGTTSPPGQPGSASNR